MQTFSEFIMSCQELEKLETPYAVATIVKIDAHVPQEVGAKMIVTKDGHHSGTVGGGKLEAKCIALGVERLNSGAPVARGTMHKIDLNQDLGMSCGGVAHVFIESSQISPWTVAVYGAGHVGQALVSLLATCSCTIYCIDPRPEWLDRLPDHPRLKKILAADSSPIPSTLPPNTYHVIATQGHLFDLVVLREVLKLQNIPYIGVIGSRVKARSIRATLKSEGYTPEDLERFHCPMGLTIGDNSPPEIAISIVAQLLETRDQFKNKKSP